MRPQIRSLPLCKVECPQFSWAVRNNSENVSVVLQPDLHNEGATNVEDIDGFELAPNKSCCCGDERLRPTLFPHPVSCVCSDMPYPPENEKYRYCKLKMDQTIGDAMEEIIMENMPVFPSNVVPKTERLMKKIMRSVYIPDQVDLTDENACVECLAKDPTLLKELLDGMKQKKYREDGRGDRKTCMESGECRKGTKIKNGFDCLYDSLSTQPKASDEKKCKWEKDRVCTCKELKHELCVNCDRCKCDCRKSCLICTCKKGQNEESSKSTGENSKFTGGNTKFSDPPKRSVTIEQPTENKKHEGEIVKGKKSPKKIHKEKESSGADREPLVPSPHAKKMKKTNDKMKSSKNKTRPKSATKNSEKKRPDNIICERLELEEKKPFDQMQESGFKQSKQTSPVLIYEHYPALGGARIGSSKGPSEIAEIPNMTRGRSFNTQKNFVFNSLSSTKNSSRITHKHKIPAKMPWNWNNQPKIEDPYKGWGGTRYSWSKKVNYAALGKNVEELTNEKQGRSRGGDDGRSGRRGPRYYEYKPNLRPKSFNEFVVPDNEEEVNIKEQRKYRNGYGRMRVKSWQEALLENKEDSKKVEPTRMVTKEKSEDPEEDNQASDEENRDMKQCLQCLMSDVQQRFIGSSDNLCQHHGTKKAAHFETSSKKKINPNLEKSLEIEDTGTRLSTILEENSGRYDSKSDGSMEIDRSRNINNEKGSCGLGTRKERPNTAEDYLVDTPERPLFNVIKQRIHSRSKTLENFDRFRNDIFTEKAETEHTCVHRFTIDERLFPKPLHCDDSGTSCCIHCDRPMTPSQKSVFLDQRDSKEKVGEETKVQRQVSKFSLRQKPVHLGAKNSVMEIKLRPEHDELLKGYEAVKGIKREYYTNSLALRHQRR